MPWTICGAESCFWVEDADSKRFGFTYFDDAPTTGGDSYRKLRRHEAWRIVRAIVRLPELMGTGRQDCAGS